MANSVAVSSRTKTTEEGVAHLHASISQGEDTVERLSSVNVRLIEIGMMTAMMITVPASHGMVAVEEMSITVAIEVAVLEIGPIINDPATVLTSWINLTATGVGRAGVVHHMVNCTSVTVISHRRENGRGIFRQRKRRGTSEISETGIKTGTSGITTIGISETTTTGISVVVPTNETFMTEIQEETSFLADKDSSSSRVSVYTCVQGE